MKIIKELLFMLLFTSMIGFSSCSKDEECLSKIVTIHCTNKPANFMIYAIENTNIPIYENKIEYGNQFEVELNIGNYMIWPGRNGFQVISNKSTIITISNDQSVVEYK